MPKNVNYADQRNSRDKICGFYRNGKVTNRLIAEWHHFYQVEIIKSNVTNLNPPKVFTDK